MIPNLKGEVWKQFSDPSWRRNDLFDISNYGRIKHYKNDPKGEFLKTYMLNGYEVFSTLKKNGKTSLIYIHRAVAQLFLEEIEGKNLVIHKDFNKANNHIDNLQFANRKELTEHNKNNPAVIQAKKEALLKPKYAKLTPEKVRLLKKKIFDPNRRTRLRLIAKQFGISEMQLYRIKSGKNWGHIDYK